MDLSIILEDAVRSVQTERLAEAQSDRVRAQLPKHPSARTWRRAATLAAALMCVAIVIAAIAFGAPPHPVSSDSVVAAALFSD